MKRVQKIAAVLIIAVLQFSVTAQASSFPDVADSADYAEAADFLNDIGIMVGDTAGNFNPNKIVTRAEMATIICRLLGETEDLSVSNKFSDVPTSHWANAYISTAADFGIVNGYGNGLFGPEDDVTYEQAVKMIVCAVGWDSEAEDAGGYPNGYLAVAEENTLLNGLVAQRGEGLSRADVARMLGNYLNVNY